MQDAPPPGWYTDPQNPYQQRYWDGFEWTDQTAPAAPPLGQRQGYGYGYPLAGPPPPNYLVHAILATVLCCLPFGIVAIVKSAEVNNKWNMGDAAGARQSSDAAKKWAMWSMLAALIPFLVYIIVIVAIGGLTTTSGF